jgi:phospholipid/cholesterol/gamma-HCH transport system ATP-binding protein
MHIYPPAPATPPQEAPPPPKEAALIELDQISVTFGRQHVLRGIDLHVPRGQTLVVIGESGCGKTVLLKLIVGLLHPTAGKVRFDGRTLADLQGEELIRQRRRIGFLFQGAALFDSLTVNDNVAFGLRALGSVGEDEVRERVHKRLAEVGLPENVLPKRPAELSGGMKKRVGLARALALDPEVMLYDEPTTGLDPIMSDVINELILRARQQQPITSVVVTHDMKTAQKVADRVVMLYPLARLPADEPQVLFDGTPAELRDCPDPRVRQFVEGEARDRLTQVENGA